jgi:hypothetical protein
VSLLRRLLYLHALVSAVAGVALVAAPRWLMELLEQPGSVDHAWLRLLGVNGLVLALLMVLVGHRAEELWWWSWAFVILDVGTGAVAGLHAAVGLPQDSVAWPWWVGAVAGLGFAGGLVVALARAGTEAGAP